MNNTAYSPINTPAWQQLEKLAAQLDNAESPKTIKALFDNDRSRADKYTLQDGELLLDFSKNLVSDQVWQHLLQLA